MSLAYVDKLVKDKNCVKYLPFQQYLIDRIVDAKALNTKSSKEMFVHFGLWLQRRVDTTKFGSTGKQNLLESWKNFAKLKDYIFNLQSVRPRLHLLNVQYCH